MTAVETSQSVSSEALHEEASGPTRQDTLSLLAALKIDFGNQPQDVRAALEALAAEVLATRTENKKLTKQLSDMELLADRDPLCAVFNRRAFERELSREIALASRYGSPLSLIYIDLDRFKQINDVFGHQTGDDVLKLVVSLLSQHVRESDIIGRLGGDEFAIALTHANASAAESKATDLTARIDAMNVRENGSEQARIIQLGASCGVVSWSPGLTAVQMIAQADEKMFITKAARRK